MANTRTPLAYYFAATGAVVSWGAGEWLSSQPWWSQVPVLWLVAVFVSFGAGLLLQDLYNPRSPIRKMWRKWNRKFEVINARIDRNETPHDHTAIRCSIRFLKDLKAPLLTIRVIEPVISGDRTHVVQTETLSDVTKHQVMHLRLGSITVTSPQWVPRHSVWGPELGDVDLKPNQHSIICGFRSTVEVVISRQTYRLYVNRPLGQTENGYLEIISEDEIEALASIGI